MITFNCQCGNTISVEDKLEGTVGKCNACGIQLKVPKKRVTGDANSFVDWTRKKAYALVAVALLVGLGVGFGVGKEYTRYQFRLYLAKYYPQSQPNTQSTSPSAAITPPPVVTEKLVTMEQFNALYEGMTYEQVVLSIGMPYEEGFTSIGMNSDYRSYYWKATPKGNVSVSFRDGYLTNKNLTR